MANRFLPLLLEEYDATFAENDASDFCVVTKKNHGYDSASLIRKPDESFIGIDTLGGHQIAIFMSNGQRIFRPLLDLDSASYLPENKKSSKTRDSKIDYPDPKVKEREIKESIMDCLAALRKKFNDLETFLNSDSVHAFGCNFHDTRQQVKKNQRNIISRLKEYFQLKAGENLKKYGLVFFLNIKIVDADIINPSHVINLGFYQN